MVKDVNPGAGYEGSSIRLMSNVTGVLFFAATTPQHGQELWKSDGTSAGTVMVKDITAGIGSTGFQQMAVLKDKLYFTIYEAGKFQLWMSDGAEAGTVMMKEFQYTGSLAVSNNILYFAVSIENGQRELWRSDGTIETTVLVTDIEVNYSSSPESLTNVNGTLYFSAATPGEGRELWKTDGTPGGTVLVTDINPGTGNSNLNYFVTTGGKLYFIANIAFL